LYRLHDWDGVIEALEKRNALTSRRRPYRHQYSEDEIALFEARFFRHYDGRVLRRALQRVMDERAPTAHRLQMAVVALVVADNTQKRREADQISEMVESIVPRTPQDDVDKARARTVYHAAFGDIDIALAAATVVVRNERAMPQNLPLLRALRWLSTARKLANDVDGAIAALNESFEVASHFSLQAEQWQAALYLQDLAIDCENLALAKQWTGIAMDLEMVASPGRNRSSNSSYLTARVALMEGDFALARSMLDHAQGHDKSILRTRARESLLAVDLLLKMQSPRSAVSRQQVARLRNLHMITRGCGVRDFETGVLLGGLIGVGEMRDAGTLCDEYFRVRRTRLQPHSILQAAKTRLR
jgi:hypothetical protein